MGESVVTLVLLLQAGSTHVHIDLRADQKLCSTLVDTILNVALGIFEAQRLWDFGQYDMQSGDGDVASATVVLLED